MPLPTPEDLTSLVLRTDFSNDTAWDAVRTAIDATDEYPQATYVSDPAYAGLTIQALVDAESATDDNDKAGYVFLADEVTMTDRERPLLAVDLYDEPGRTFRVTPQWYPDVSANLSIANMDFCDFADAAATGTFRGFDD